MHHPWRAFRELSDWTLHWTDELPPLQLGLTHFPTKTVWLAEGMTQAQRRCTIAHETQHILRGPIPGDDWTREERTIDRLVGRLLLPRVGTIGHVLGWAVDFDEAASDLWVDLDTLMCRLRGLAPMERRRLQRMLRERDGLVDPAAAPRGAQ
ncbi:hypothetical protein [Nocardioides kribbensis]|uniref:ImmA/IrrE family metallo-endopeptidase n=1 Tax=Nocardioides kribbensis TaxID=305517 RepID=A0ABV1NZ64_9ACTN